MVDNQDFLNIDFTIPIKRFRSWSFPVKTINKANFEGSFQRWKVNFDERSELKKKLKFSAEIENFTAEPAGIQDIRMCPCSLNL